jgi:quercetin dioxygenase-like cupin family protein
MTRKLALLFGAAIVASAGLGYTAHSEMAGMMTPANQIDWQPIAEDSPLQMAVLFGDPSKGENVRMFKLPAGHVVPVHMHTGDYHGVNVAGTWRHTFDGGEDLKLPAGSYVFQPGGQFHGDACVGPEECIIMVYQSGPADYIPKDQ